MSVEQTIQWIEAQPEWRDRPASWRLETWPLPLVQIIERLNEACDRGAHHDGCPHAASGAAHVEPLTGQQTRPKSNWELRCEAAERDRDHLREIDAKREEVFQRVIEQRNELTKRERQVLLPLLALAAEAFCSLRCPSVFKSADEPRHLPECEKMRATLAQGRCAPPQAGTPQDGATQIAAERQRQITTEGWTSEHDDEHTGGELRDAAIAYTMACDPRAGENAVDVFPATWDRSWWNPIDDPVRNLVKAGALIAAEIDRLQRSR